MGPHAFHHVAPRAAFERGEQAVLVIKSGQHYDPCRWTGLRQFLHRCQPSPAGHADVEQHDIRSVLYGQTQCLLAALSLPYHCEVGLGGQRVANTLAEQRMIIGNNNTDRFGHVSSLLVRGISARTTVP